MTIAVRILCLVLLSDKKKMLGAGIEPAWALAQGILSPSRLPVSPPEPRIAYY